MEHIQEMARLGSIKNIEIWVYHENLMNPSFHIKTKRLTKLFYKLKILKS